MSNEIINPYQTFYDNSGIPLANGTISFLVNTKTALGTIFSDEALSVAQANPYTLDASGRIAGDVKYTGQRTLLIKTDLGATVRTIDDVSTTSNELTVNKKLNPLTVVAMTDDVNFSTDDVDKSAPITKEFSDGNGGGGTYDIALTTTVTPNTYDVIIGVADPDISFVLRQEGQVSVRQFGATGNGKTDDSGAFKAAIDFSSGTTPHKVYVPAGTYKITETLYLYKEGMSFVGESMAASRINFAAGILGLVGGNSPTTSNDIHDMLIADLHLSGGTSPLQVGSLTSPLTYIGQVNRVRVTDGTVSGLNIFQCVASFSDMMLTENQIGMQAFNAANGGQFPTASVFSRCRFWFNTDQGVRAETMLGFKFDTCTFESNGKEGFEFVQEQSAILWLKHILFDTCWFENNMTGGGTSSASVLFTKVDATPIEDVIFIGCNFSGVAGFPGNINVKGEISRVTFIQNRSIGPDTGGINITTTGATGIYIGPISDLVNQQLLTIIADESLSLNQPMFSKKNTALGKAVIDSGATAGVEVRPDLGGLTFFARAGNPITSNRIGSDGQHLIFRTDGVGNVGVYEGVGTPEGAQTAVVGCTYHRSDGGAGTSFYVKESGTGNVGWVAK